MCKGGEDRPCVRDPGEEEEGSELFLYLSKRNMPCLATPLIFHCERAERIQYSLSAGPRSWAHTCQMTMALGSRVPGPLLTTSTDFWVLFRLLSVLICVQTATRTHQRQGVLCSSEWDFRLYTAWFPAVVHRKGSWHRDLQSSPSRRGPWGAFEHEPSHPW